MALEKAVAILRAVAPESAPTGLADALWLASRMAPEPPGPAERPVAPVPPMPAEPPRRDALPGNTRDDVPTEPAVPGMPEPPAPTLHERLPESGTPVSGHALALPRATALPFTAPVIRALRPWKRPWPRGRRHTLDVDATVEAYSRGGELLPVLSPAAERWFDLTLVVDRSPSMGVWQDTVEALVRVLDALAAFRTVQIRDLRFRPDHGFELTDRHGLPVAADRPGSPDGRRLVLVFSDFAGRPWRAPGVWQRLRRWARSTPVALLNPLPTRLWRHTGLDLPTVRVTASTPGTASGGLAFRLPPLLPRTAANGTDGWLAVPVVSLSAHSLEQWSRALMLAAPEGCAAVLVPPEGRPAAPGPAWPAPRRDAAARATGFLRTAAPAAARLAVLCSPFDRLSTDLLHVLREELVPEATTADVAELLSSGLFALGGEPTGTVVLHAPHEVRVRLEQELSEHEALRLSRALGRHVAAGSDGLRRLPVVAGGDTDAPALTAEATPAGRALARTLELLGLPNTQETPPGITELVRSLPVDALAEAVPAPRADPTELAVRMAALLLPAGQQPIVGDVERALDAVVSMLRGQGIEVDRRNLARELGTGAAVERDRSGRRAWFESDPYPDFGVTFWGRYRTLLDADPPLRESVDASTDVLLSHLEDPRSPGPWLRAGVVASREPSPRSEVMTGLAAKALDAGYRVIVILSGPHNAERAQVQAQVDEGLLGFDSAYQRVATRHDPLLRPIGVGQVASPHLEVAALTGSAGDFSPHRTAQLPDPDDHVPLVLVIKKNRTVVGNVRSWFARRARRWNTTAEHPLLVVDMTGGPGSTDVRTGGPSAVDEAVHGLLTDFEKSAYVSFAYAPFLPVRLPEGGVRQLYQADFVLQLPRTPEGGRLGTPAGTPAVPPRIRQVTDHGTWMPAGHRSSHVPGTELPASLREAVHAFVLSAAVRTARGEVGAHNSMLVSVSRFTWVQAQVRLSLAAYVRTVAAALREPGHRLRAEFKALWRSGFGRTGGSAAGGHTPLPAWEQLAEVVGRTSVVLVNSTVDGLPPWDLSSSGLNTIAVGGTKLAHGAALAGLTVGYYLRPTSRSETLPQLDSAFGFRTGYEDLCRLYVTPEVLGRPVEDFSGRTVATTEFGLSPEVRRANVRTLEGFVAALDTAGSAAVSADGGNLLWRGVSPLLVVEQFLDPYAAVRDGIRESLRLLSAYVRGRVADGELTWWTVQLVHGPGRSGEVRVCGHRVGLVERRPRTTTDAESGTYRIGVLHSLRDEYADLDTDQFAQALMLTRTPGAESPSRPSHAAVQAVRRPDQALLTIYLVRPTLPDSTGDADPLVGFTVSLPQSAALTHLT
ncbi:SAV_2336 N-terminal domain-related protein [Streptomyces sp. NPDC090493]|uniref:SAV_2336 N-terminal domain-related protein n=1 Tax=Streptomyces sp. NPDC090493 TaxID=3365964 RepID=UPI003805AD69